ncbi:MAG: lysylphosphatidylglycerol synthase domain-containing protein, partial [Patescibacteria group bacterium]
MKLTNQKYLKLIAQVIIIGLALWILAPQVSELVRNRQTISSLSLGWLVAGLAIFLLSNIFAAYVYQYLSPKKLSFKKNVQVQLATGFTNRLLPAGIGGISTNSLFLMRAGYKRPQAVSIALANNLVGFLAFGLVLVASGALLPSSLSSIFSDTSPIYLWATAGVVIVALVVTMLSEKLRELIQKNLLLGISVLKDTLARPLHLILALLSSAGIAFCFVGALYCCLRGAGIVLSPNEL